MAAAKAATTRYLLLSAVGAGLLLALAWPCIGGLSPLIFLAWVPLLLAEERFASLSIPERPRHFMPFVFFALLVWNLCTTWWLAAVSEPVGTRMFTLIGPNVGNVLVMSVPWVVMRLVRWTSGGRVARWAWVFLWLGFEHFHMDWDLTWPWLTLGNVFANKVAWVQWYELTGVAGGSLWVLVVNVLFVEVLLLRARGNAGGRWRRKGVIALLVVVLPICLSWGRYAGYKDHGVPQEVVVVQPNIDPYKEKFGSVDPLMQLDRMLGLAAQAATDSTVLVVLPETALQEPFTLGFDGAQLVLQGLWENALDNARSVARIRAFNAHYPRMAVLAGMSSGHLFPPGAELPITARVLDDVGRGFDSYNAALLVGPDGSVEPYHKSKLVPGVELMPFEEVLGSLAGFALDLGGTTGSLGTQEEREVMRVPATGVAAAPVICYESIYGDHVAAHVRNGATSIVIMTNDGWWGDSPGYKHHLAYGRLRAIENRRSIARSANTGISCFIDQRGDVHQATGWWTPAVIRGTLHARTDLTFFSRYGDLIGKAASWSYPLLLVWVLISFFRRRSAKAGM